MKYFGSGKALVVSAVLGYSNGLYGLLPHGWRFSGCKTANGNVRNYLQHIEPTGYRSSILLPTGISTSYGLPYRAHAVHANFAPLVLGSRKTGAKSSHCLWQHVLQWRAAFRCLCSGGNFSAQPIKVGIMLPIWASRYSDQGTRHHPGAGRPDIQPCPFDRVVGAPPMVSRADAHFEHASRTFRRSLVKRTIPAMGQGGGGIHAAGG